jgi:hypothetical protein
MSGQGFVMAVDEVLQQMRLYGIEVDDAGIFPTIDSGTRR